MWKYNEYSAHVDKPLEAHSDPQDYVDESNQFIPLVKEVKKTQHLRKSNDSIDLA